MAEFVPDLELSSKPELDDLVFVQLTPDVQYTEDHRVHQQLQNRTANMHQ